MMVMAIGAQKTLSASGIIPRMAAKGGQNHRTCTPHGRVDDGAMAAVDEECQKRL
jgi:hypothetical protein